MFAWDNGLYTPHLGVDLSNPKPITVTYVDPEDFDGPFEPQPFVVVGEPPTPGDRAFRDYLRSLPGFGVPFAILAIGEDGETIEWAAV